MTAEERGYLAAISVDYALRIAQRLTDGGRIVPGTEKARRTADWIRYEMTHTAGISEGDVTIEEFPVVGYDLDEETSDPNLGRTSLAISTGGAWEAIPAAQLLKGNGTGPDGVAAEVVDVGLGRLEDFESVGASTIRGRIVLFRASELLFDGAPVQSMAARRGAVGAIMHWPIAPDSALRVHTMMGTVPMVSVSNRDATRIRKGLAHGPVTAKLVVDNHRDEGPRHTGYNVLGSIPGSEVPDEYVYLCAHYDHWFTSAADNNAGVGSLLAVAKAFADAGVRPRRTVVFACFDAEEFGGWSDTWYDWLIGSYSHIVETLDGRVLHPGLPDRIAAMFNMDVVGTKGADVILETTPELASFLRRAAADSKLTPKHPLHMLPSPTSYDDWPFFLMGVPVAQIAWWGDAYQPLYHTTADTMDSLDPKNVRLNTSFMGLATLRTAQASLLPYDLRGNFRALHRGLRSLRGIEARYLQAMGIPDLQRSVRAFERLVHRLKRRSPHEDSAEEINGAMRAALSRLNPSMFAWDFAVHAPGWTSEFVLANPANDLHWMKKAVDHLGNHRPRLARKALAEVTTMAWGQYVDGPARREILDYTYSIPPSHLLWGRPRPPIPDVHDEFETLGSKMQRRHADYEIEERSLTGKMDRLARAAQAPCEDLGRALDEATAILVRVK